MSTQPGRLKLAGSLSGPSSSWAITEVKLAEALERSGAPKRALRLHVEGGWLTLEPSQSDWPLDGFASGPAAEVLAQTLQELLQSVTPQCEVRERVPSEWASTLRLTEFHPKHKFEVLFGLTAEGIQAVGRESPWCPVPPPKARDWWARNWRLTLAIVVALASMLYLQRDYLKAEWQRWNEPAATSGSPASSDPPVAQDSPARSDSAE